ncbi:hypothetical protein Q667_00635 [Marinobacter sp. C1S70]|nr:hypothetical protein Q667_00635 [Marinobacter sp. C1S70]
MMYSLECLTSVNSQPEDDTVTMVQWRGGFME